MTKEQAQRMVSLTVSMEVDDLTRGMDGKVDKPAVIRRVNAFILDYTKRNPLFAEALGAAPLGADDIANTLDVALRLREPQHG